MKISKLKKNVNYLHFTCGTILGYVVVVDLSNMSIGQFLEFFPAILFGDFDVILSAIFRVEPRYIALIPFFVSHSIAMYCNRVDCSFVHYVLLYWQKNVLLAELSQL